MSTILLCGLYGESSWKVPFFEDIAQALESLGHRVHRFDMTVTQNVPGWQRSVERLLTGPGKLLGIEKEAMRRSFPWRLDYAREQDLVATADRIRPDLLVAISYVRINRTTLMRIRDLGSTLVGWNVEGPGPRRVQERDCGLYDRYFSIHRHLLPGFEDLIGLLPAWAYSDRVFRPEHHRGEKSHAITFVGNCTPRRLRYLEAIADLPLSIWGPGGWQDRAVLRGSFRSEFIWGEALNRAYNDSAIVLDIPSWDPAMTGTTQRIVDVPASGAFLLANHSDDYRRIYSIGDEIDTFESPTDLRRKCLYYLERPDVVRQIAQAGYQRAIRLPTYVDRARTLTSSWSASSSAK